MVGVEISEVPTYIKIVGSVVAVCMVVAACFLIGVVVSFARSYFKGVSDEDQ